MLPLFRFLPFGRTLRKSKGIALVVVAGLAYAGQTGPALEMLAWTGVDLRWIVDVDSAQASDHGEVAQRQAQASDRLASRPTASASYDRDNYGDWADEDGNCRNTRAEVLIASSTGPVHMRKGNCSVDRGKWFDPYTGKTFTKAGDLDIDHLVPLAWANAHGASEWPADRKRAFANWQANLFPVQASVNREKGASGPIHWLPPRVEYRCEYMLRFERVMVAWGLHYYRSEADAMKTLKAHYCPARG